MEHKIDVAPMSKWDGIEETTEVIPMQVAEYIKNGWVLLMMYARRHDVAEQQFGANGCVIYNTRCEYETVALMGRTDLDKLRSNLNTATANVTRLNGFVEKFTKLDEEHKRLQSNKKLVDEQVTANEERLAQCRKDYYDALGQKQKMETDIAKIRGALGDLRMKEILG